MALTRSTSEARSLPRSLSYLSLRTDAPPRNAAPMFPASRARRNRRTFRRARQVLHGCSETAASIVVVGSIGESERRRRR